MALPGVAAVIADGRLRIAPTVSGPKLTILGTCYNSLSTFEPYSITDGRTGIGALQHTDGSPSELSMAVEEALLAGAQNIEVVKISNVSGELGNATFSASDRWDALYTAYIELRAHDVDVIFPAGTYIDDPNLTGTDTGGFTRDNFGRQLADFCHRATTTDGNTCVGVIGVRPIMKVARDEAWTGAPANLQEEFFSLPTRAHLIEYVAHLTGGTGEMAHSADELTTSGFLAGSDEESVGNVSTSYLFWARNDAGTTATDQYGTSVDAGGFLSVVAGVCRFIGPNTVRGLSSKYLYTSRATVNSNGAAAYAGFITTLDPQIGTTNKSIAGLIPARELSRTQANAILDDRYVTFFRRSVGYVVLKGVTGAYNATDYTRSDFVMLTTRRITNAALDIVVRSAEPFIGEPLNEYNKNALTAAIDSGLRAFQVAGALRRYNFKLEATPEAQVLGQAFVYLTIVPAFELTNVTVYLQLAKE